MLYRKLLPTAALFIMASNLPAFAYLDPGTGSIIVQSLIGSLAAAGAFFGIYLQQIKTLTRRVLGRTTAEDEGSGK